METVGKERIHLRRQREGGTRMGEQEERMRNNLREVLGPGHEPLAVV